MATRALNSALCCFLFTPTSLASLDRSALAYPPVQKTGAAADDENVRWAWLRAVEWVGWPLFISQPVVPILFYLYPWPAVLGVIVCVAFFWRAVVVPFWISPSLAYVGPLIVALKFIAAPVMAYLLWQRGDTLIAAAALLWPLLGPTVASWIMILPTALLSLTPLGKASQIGIVQSRFLLAVGFHPTET
jgi:hypothetical protein